MKEFPDISSKLAAPAKRSLFERQRAEAEAKRQRAEAETAAVLDDFVKSFDHDEDDEHESLAAGDGPRQSTRPISSLEPSLRAPSGPPKRHFTSGQRTSGPGSLGPPPDLSRKRTYDQRRLDASPQRAGEQERGDLGLFAYDDDDNGAGDSPVALGVRLGEDDGNTGSGHGTVEEERAAPKPTVQLSSLPPGISPAVVKSLMPQTVKIEGVRMMAPSQVTEHFGAGSMDRKSINAIVTLPAEMPATDIDALVAGLQNRYLGKGYNLSISRHLSSAALGSSLPVVTMNSSSASLPFNAQPAQAAPPVGMNRAMASSVHRGGFAPPQSYNSAAYASRGQPQLEVRVAPPSDIQELRLIHKTLEMLLTHGPEFEALLMSRREVQQDTKWAWIWNPRSRGGLWYRWRLWQILTGAGKEGGQRSEQQHANMHHLFDGGIVWAEPDEALPFEYTTKFEDLVSESDYNSSDEDESGDEDGPRKRRRQFGAYAGKGAPPEDLLSAAADKHIFLNPLQKAKLTHLLARLPNSIAKLRKGDVARITSFAISHAGRGAEEIVDMLITNVAQPLSHSRHANPSLDRAAGEDGGSENGESGRTDTTGPGKKSDAETKEDTSPSTLVALYCISDILSASSTAGVRHSWRYRALFETALKRRKIFTHLGGLEKTLGWGRLRAEKWRRSIGGVLERWEQWSLFSNETHAGFVKELDDGLRKGEGEKKEKEDKLLKESGAGSGNKSKWRAVDAPMSRDDPASTSDPMDVDGEVDATKSVDDPKSVLAEKPANVAEMARARAAQARQSRAAAGDVTEAEAERPAARTAGHVGTASAGDMAKRDIGSSEHDTTTTTSQSSAAAKPMRRPRPKAEDMFADSDEE